jgi:hypothetical protein
MDAKLTQWKTEVLERDDYTCQNCGANTNLDAAHIHSRGARPDLKYDVNNGVTLCRNCHSTFHGDPKYFANFLKCWLAGFTNPKANVDTPPSALRNSQDKRFSDSPQERRDSRVKAQLQFTDDWVAQVNERVRHQES